MIRKQAIGTLDSGWLALSDVAIVVAAAYLIALSAHLQIRLPFTPVPATLQTLVVLLIGSLLTRRQALASVGLYLVGGLARLPFFAGGSLWGPTGGYLIGFLVAVYVVGGLLEAGWRRNPSTASLALLVGNAAIYLFGLPWLALFVGPRSALPLGLWPFVGGDLLKLICAVGLISMGGVLGSDRGDLTQDISQRWRV